MAEPDRRNTLISELANRLNQPTSYWQSLDDATLEEVAAAAVMLMRLNQRTEATLKEMSDNDVRNTLIVWLSPRTGQSVSALQALGTWELVTSAQTFCTDESGWRCFASMTDFEGDPWYKYHKLVYGFVPTMAFPLCFADVWMFYDDLLAQAGAAAPPVSGDCPQVAAPRGQRYRTNNIYAPPGTSWIWHPPPYSAFSSGSWVEVIHEADPFGDEHVGAWFLYAQGSGMWLNLGKTIAFNEHGDASAYFGANSNEDIAMKAAAWGYDSIQFLAHTDHVNYPCDNAAQAPYMNREIVGTRLVGTFACTTAAGAPSTISAGWPPLFGRVCNCDNSKRVLNCNGVGLMRSQLPSSSLVV